jgi:hypothetical protein
MSTLAAHGPDREGRWLYRVGGLSALLIGVGYLLAIAAYVSVIGPPVTGVVDRITSTAAHATTWWVILGLNVLTDVLFVPVALALYLALKDRHQGMMLVGTACMALFIVLDLALTWPSYASFIVLGGRYLAATSDAERTLAVTAATLAHTMMDTFLTVIYTILFPALWHLLTGVVMLKSAFSRPTAWLGIVAGVLSIVSVVGPFFVKELGFAVVLASLLIAVWVFLLGFRLFRLARP